MRKLFQEWYASLRAARLVRQHGQRATAPAPRTTEPANEPEPLEVQVLESRQLPSVVGTGAGLTGSYYGDQDFTTLRLTRTDPTVNFNWNTQAPAASLPTQHYSIRWTGQVQAPDSGLYTFYTRSDDGVRLMVNGQTLVNNWTVHPP